MTSVRKKHIAAFKVKVDIEAQKERETLSDLVRRFELHPQQISDWKREFVKRSSEIFSNKSPDLESELREKRLYEKIGRLEMERELTGSKNLTFERGKTSLSSLLTQSALQSRRSTKKWGLRSPPKRDKSPIKVECSLSK